MEHMEVEEPRGVVEARESIQRLQGQLMSLKLVTGTMAFTALAFCSAMLAKDDGYREAAVAESKLQTVLDEKVVLEKKYMTAMDSILKKFHEVEHSLATLAHSEQPAEQAGYFSLRRGGDSYAQCGHIIKETLKAHAADLSQDTATRVGQLLGSHLVWKDTAGGFGRECCARGTEYDHFLLARAEPQPWGALLPGGVDARTMLIVVGMQRDFATGSFAQPCWSQGGAGLSKAIAETARAFAAAGATVVATKDFHPQDHCSFTGKCKNTKDYEHERMSADQRYVNYFPSHCSFGVQEGRVVPLAGGETPFCQVAAHKALPFCSDSNFVGSAFVEPVAAAMWEIAQNSPEQVEVVYKGFHQDYSSFSAFPHWTTSGPVELKEEEQTWTGGYALPAKRKAACFQAENFEDEACYPSAKEFDTAPEALRSILSITKERKTKKIAVVGLVYDYSVKETAIFAREVPDHLFDVSVIADLTRPSFDGKPGAPFVASVCDGGEAEGQFCTKGGGTLASHEAVLQDLRRNRVKFVRHAPASAATAKEAVASLQV